MAREPVVTLLGGAPSTGKTTVANLLVRELGLSHHISTRFIRASIRHLLPEPQARLLHLQEESVARARSHGCPVVINHSLPTILQDIQALLRALHHRPFQAPHGRAPRIDTLFNEPLR